MAGQQTSIEELVERLRAWREGADRRYLEHAGREGFLSKALEKRRQELRDDAGALVAQGRGMAEGDADAELAPGSRRKWLIRAAEWNAAVAEHVQKLLEKAEAEHDDGVKVFEDAKAAGLAILAEAGVPVADFEARKAAMKARGGSPGDWTVPLHALAADVCAEAMPAAASAEAKASEAGEKVNSLRSAVDDFASAERHARNAARIMAGKTLLEV